MINYKEWSVNRCPGFSSKRMITVNGRAQYFVLTVID